MKTMRDALGDLAGMKNAIEASAFDAVIAVSPTDPEPNDTVFFNGTGSTAAAGRTVVSYNWDFGDGLTASGATAQRRATYTTSMANSSSRSR